jgi:hypothetical protein
MNLMSGKCLLNQATCSPEFFDDVQGPVNFSGMVAADVLRGDMPISHWHEMDEGVILDVREPFELAVENVEGAVKIPLGQLRARLLLQQGFDARNVSGGMLSRTYASFFLQEGPVY